MLRQDRHISVGFVSSIVVAIGLSAIAYCCMYGNVKGALIVVALPFAALWFGLSVQYPIFSLFTYGFVASFWGAIARYLAKSSNISIVLEIALVYFFAYMLFNSLFTQKFQWKQAFNIMTVCFFIWFLYCFAEIANPRALTEAWINSRGFYPNALLFAVFCSALFTKYKYVKYLLNGLAVFVILTFIKLMIQRHVGFDESERLWLAAGNDRTHLMAQGIRFFSTFSDAGNFGSNMGGFTLMYAILAVYTHNKHFKYLYILVAILSCIGMFMSGTRGAMIVPLGGLMLFTAISKNWKMTTLCGILGICVYVFFACTYIGEGNQQIRRMRTAFRPSEDASLNVRLENQKLIAEYLKDKPFGEGMGLAGVEAAKYGGRYITSIPVDSYYVKIWVQFGIVGLLLHIAMFAILIAWGCYTIMFRVKDEKLRIFLSSMICALFGLMLSAYGNQFFSQPNTQFILFTFMACILNGPYIDKELAKRESQKQISATNRTITI